MSEQIKSENQQSQQEGENKVVKNYESTMNKLVAIVGGKDKLTPSKRVKKDVLQAVVVDLLKEDKEASELAIKTELKELLGKHVTLTKEIIAKKKEFEQLEQNKMKEFTEAANKLFGKIDNLGQMEKDYYDALKSTQ